MTLRMKPLHAFLDQLRAAGFEISPAVTLDIVKILADVDDIEQLRLSLRMLICTTQQQQDLFDFIWDIEYPELSGGSDEEKSGETEEPLDSTQDNNPDDLPLQLPESVTDAEYCPNPGAIATGSIGSNDPSVALIRFASDMKGPARQMIQGNYRNAGAILLRYLLSSISDISQFGMQRDLALQEIGEMLDYAVPDHSADLLRRLDEQLSQLLQEQIAEGDIMGNQKLRVRQIEEIPLLSLKSSPELHQTLRQLGKKLASKHVRKQKKGSRKINLRQTIRANIQHGGTMLELKRKNPRLDRPKLVIMTDVSTSTIKATRMFLTILWHAKHVFSDIRFFEFIASVIDVTTEWRRAESVDDAVDQALKRWEKQSFGKQNSDYHQAFSMFLRQYSNTLSSRDTIIILGDLRDWLGPWRDNTPVSATVMNQLQDYVKRVIVLNPEKQSSWNTGDSIVNFIEAKGIEVYETNTLQRLIDVMLDIE